MTKLALLVRSLLCFADIRTELLTDNPPSNQFRKANFNPCNSWSWTSRLDEWLSASHSSCPTSKSGSISPVHPLKQAQNTPLLVCLPLVSPHQQAAFRGYPRLLLSVLSSLSYLPVWLWIFVKHRCLFCYCKPRIDSIIPAWVVIIYWWEVDAKILSVVNAPIYRQIYNPA